MADVDADTPPDVLGLDSAARGGRDAYTIEPATAAESDTEPPTIANISPALGTNVAPGGTVHFDLVDADSSFAVAAVLARFEAAGLYDVVHDGDGWAPLYVGSTRTAIAGGWRYVLRRRGGGWPRETLRIRLLAVDAAGNAVVL